MELGIKFILLKIFMENHMLPFSQYASWSFKDQKLHMPCYEVYWT